MKSGLLSMLFFLGAWSAQAERIPQLLMIWAKDGSRQAFALAERPEISFTETALFLKGASVEVSYPLDDLARFTYEENDVTGITSLQTGEKQFELSEESIYFPRLKAKSQIRIYSVDGKLVGVQSVAEEGDYTYPLTSLQPGTYLVNVNGITTKIMKR